MSKLNHKEIANDMHFHQVKQEIDSLISTLEQRHYLQRKIQFLLDVRGYIKVNNMIGDYVEFGSFKSEVQYSAFNVLESTGCVNKYIALDAFSADLAVTDDDVEHHSYAKPSDFVCNYEDVKSFVSKEIGEKGIIIPGDFRSKEVKTRFFKEVDKISVAVFDCNFISSTKSALEMFLSKAKSGSVVFFDDYLTNFTAGQSIMQELIHSHTTKNNCRLIELGYYPPFAKSFILERKYGQ